MNVDVEVAAPYTMVKIVGKPGTDPITWWTLRLSVEQAFDLLDALYEALEEKED